MTNSRAPNIVLIFTDQHRGDALGCIGNQAVKTPNLDALAQEGVAFSNCSTSSPLCMPARASLLTGQYVNEHGGWGNRHEADRHGPSHVRSIRDAGYFTAVIGKTHFRVPQADEGHTRDHAWILEEWGYEFSHELNEAIPSPRHRCYHSDFLAERGRLQIHEDMCRTWRMGQQMQSLRPWEHTPWLLEEDEHIDAYIADTASAWIRDYSDDRPFYLQVALIGPHPPFNAPARFRDMFEPGQMPLPIMEWPKGPVPPQVERMLSRRGLANMTESQARLMISHYYALIAFDDYIIGRLMDTLLQEGLMDNTWIIYTSDHGEMLGDHRLNQKVVFYEGAVNIPLIIRPPAGTESWVANGLTDHYDIVETMLDAADADRDGDRHGSSLIPKIQSGPDADDAQQGKEVVFSEVNLCSMARTEKYKMSIDSVTRKPLELYDMEEDPQELHNLVNETSLEAVRTGFLDEHFNRLLNKVNEAQLEVALSGGIPSSIHGEYPQY